MVDVAFLFHRLALSYVLDWVILLALAAAAAAFTILAPTHTPFAPPPFALNTTSPSSSSFLSPTSPTAGISLPYLPDTVTIPVVFLTAVVAPAAITLLVSLLLRGPRVSIKRRLWEWHTAWLGLALSVVMGFFVVQTLKNLFGKLRPDFLERCGVDPARAREAAWQVGLGLVTWEVCGNREGGPAGGREGARWVSKAEFEDGFRSFPSGHCTIAFAGLLYLTLFLSAKLSAVLPFLPSTPAGTHTPRTHAAAAPLHLLLLTLLPTGAATYIAGTRYADGKHHGFDVLISSIFGAACAWFAFRWYHLPVRRGEGWAWAPRSNGAAFGVGVGAGGYGNQRGIGGDLEAGKKEEGMGMGALGAQPAGAGAWQGGQEQVEMENFAAGAGRGVSGSSTRPLREA
ncbi:PAP2 superfamily-domain-containing protein [Geopyxis carbonaria]|nr:PAP2 superfamily-domain-containing protein [Geopyxis carbonaria]